jgi:hypothetical protein
MHLNLKNLKSDFKLLQTLEGQAVNIIGTIHK